MLYEVMMILNPDLGDDGIEKVTSRYQGNVTKNGGEIIRIDDLGLKTMAYKIQKRSKGRYLLSYLDGPGPMLSELERTLKIDENVIRFLIIKLDEDVKREDLEKTAEEPKAEAAATDEGEKAVAAETAAATETTGEERHGEE